MRHVASFLRRILKNLKNGSGMDGCAMSHLFTPTSKISIKNGGWRDVPCRIFF